MLEHRANEQCDKGSPAEQSSKHESESRPPKGSFLEVLGISTKLGLTSFGGPTAHLAYFREEYVSRRKWMSDAAYADLVALCQFLPGPASSQVGIGIGLGRAGFRGAIAAWIGFTLPSAMLLFIFALAVQQFQWSGAGWIHGLKIAAIAIVAQAIWGMFRTLAPDAIRATVALCCACAVLMWPSAWMHVAVIMAAALFGKLVLKANNASIDSAASFRVGKRTGILCLSAFALLLISLPFISSLMPSIWLNMIDRFYRVGSLVFGGGHVVLPLLQEEVVASGWVAAGTFVAGYGAAQAVPGPLFTFSAYIGAAMGEGLLESSLLSATALIAIFLPSFFLVVGVLPFWGELRARKGVQSALMGVHAAVIGILLAALLDPLWMDTVTKPADIAIVLFAAALMLWKLPPWVVVIGAALAGQLLAMVI